MAARKEGGGMKTEMADRPGRRIEAKNFPPEVKGENFSDCRIEWCRAKKVVFIECDFSASLIKNCYFHRASFQNCRFVGCTITESNMRGATFAGCSFEYATFRSTYVDGRSILKNLPAWENARRELLRGLRKNAESIGDVEDVRMFLAAEMNASEEHWRSAYRQIDGYYVRHYEGLIRGRIVPFCRMLGTRIGRYFWGHGDSPLRLLISLVVWIAIAAALVKPSSWGEYMLAAKEVFAIVLGLPSRGIGVSEWLMMALAASRYLFLGLFATVFVRRFARR